jgi:hypothetical protein
MQRLSKDAKPIRSAHRFRGHVLQLEPVEDRMMLSTVLAGGQTGPIHISAPTALQDTASSTIPVTTGLVNTPVHILTGGNVGGPVQLDGDGYVENFPGSVQLIEQTWNYDKGAYDQATAANSLGNLKSIFDLMWGSTSQANTIAGKLQDAFRQQTVQYLQSQGYGVGGGGTPNFQVTDPSVNELRVKQFQQYLELKYLASGSEDFYVAHPGIGADPHITITFDVEIATTINVWPYIQSSAPSNQSLTPPLWAESADVQLHNAHVSVYEKPPWPTPSVDTNAIKNQIDAQSIDISSDVNNLLAAIDNPSLVAEANLGFPLLSFAIDGNSSVDFYVSHNPARTMNLQILGWQAPILGAGQFSPESLGLVQTSGPSSMSWTVNVSDPASVTNGRYVPVTISISRSHLPPIRVPYNGPIKDPDFPKFRFIEAPNIPYGVIGQWHLIFDLKTGAISGDATGSAAQKLQVGNPSGPAVWFQLSAH